MDTANSLLVAGPVKHGVDSKPVSTSEIGWTCWQPLISFMCMSK